MGHELSAIHIFALFWWILLVWRRKMIDIFALLIWRFHHFFLFWLGSTYLLDFVNDKDNTKEREGMCDLMPELVDCFICKRSVVCHALYHTWVPVKARQANRGHPLLSGWRKFKVSWVWWLVGLSFIRRYLICCEFTIYSVLHWTDSYLFTGYLCFAPIIE